MRDITKDFLISNAFDCQKCQALFYSSKVCWWDFTEREEYNSPICNVCLFRLILQNGHSIKYSLKDKGDYLGFKHFPNLYKVILSSIKVRAKGQRGQLLNFNPAQPYLWDSLGQSGQNPIRVCLDLTYQREVSV